MSSRFSKKCQAYCANEKLCERKPFYEVYAGDVFVGAVCKKCGDEKLQDQKLRKIKPATKRK